MTNDSTYTASILKTVPVTRGNHRRRYVKPLQENNSIFLDFNLKTEFSVAVPGPQQKNEAQITL